MANDIDGIPVPVIPSGFIVMWAGTIATIPSGYIICDGNNGTPNLLAKFVEGVATAATNPGATGGATGKTTSGHQHTLPIGGYASTDIINGAYGTVGVDMGSGNEMSASGSQTPVSQVLAKTNTDSISDIRPLYYDIAFIMKT